jgi:hypothetical protein
MPTPENLSYTISVACSGVELTDDVLDELFEKLGDVIPSSVDGCVTITASVDGAPDDFSAALRLIRRIKEALPTATVLRIDQDLVSITDIAARTNRSRESVRLLVDGKRGPGEFPAPIGTVGGGIRVWPWAAATDWFRDALDEDLEERGVSPQSAAVIDAGLAAQRNALEISEQAVHDWFMRYVGVEGNDATQLRKARKKRVAARRGTTRSGANKARGQIVSPPA